jgi:hypothetical protein
MAARLTRRPNGRRVRCAGGYWAYVPAPLPPQIALGRRTHRSALVRRLGARAILEILEGPPLSGTREAGPRREG